MEENESRMATQGQRMHVITHHRMEINLFKCKSQSKEEKDKTEITYRGLRVYLSHIDCGVAV